MRRRRPPKTLKVLGQRFDVTTLPGHVVVDASHLFSVEETEGLKMLLGLCEPDDMTITISENQGQDRMRETYLHEALHAVFSKARLQHEKVITGPEEETIVGRIAPILLDFVRTNKAVVAYLQEPAR